MQLPEQSIADEYLIGQSFLEGKISANEYLSYIASLSGEYAYKIRAIRNMQSNNINRQLSYNDFLERLEAFPGMAQQAYLLSGINRYQRIIQRLRQEVMLVIDRCYKNINRGRIKYGRES